MRAIIAAILLTTATQASAADYSRYMGTYFCTPSAGAGLYFDETAKQWEGTTFSTSGIGYIVKLSDTGRKLERSVLRYVEDGSKNSVLTAVPDYYPVVTLSVKERGKEGTRMCEDLFKDQQDQKDVALDEMVMVGSFLTCFVAGPRFQFEFSSLRFQVDARGGYIEGTAANERTDTPSIFIGTCDKID